MFSINTAFSATYYSQGTDDWSTFGNWNDAADGSGSAPASFAAMNDGTHSFVVQDGHTITVDTDFDIVGLTIGQGTSGAVTVGNNTTIRTMDISGDVLVNTNAILQTINSNVKHELIFGGSSFTNNGDMTNFDRNGNRHVNLTVNSTVFTLLAGSEILEFGSVTLDGQAVNGAIQSVQRIRARRGLTIQNTAVVTTNARWDVNNDFTIDANCSFVSSANTVYCSGTQNLTFNSAPFFNDLYIDNGTATVTGNFTVDDLLRVYNDATFASGADGVYTFNDELRVDDGGAFDLTGSLTMTATFDGTSYLNSGGGTIDFDGIDISLTGNTTCGNGNAFTMNDGDITASGNYFNLGTSTFNHTVGANTNTFTLASNTILYVRGADNFPSNFNAYALDLDSRVEYDGGAQTIRSDVKVAYPNLYLDGSTKTAGGDLNVDGDFILQDNAVVNLGGFTHTFSGELMDGSGTINSTGTFTFDAADANQEIDGGPTYTFNNLVFTQTAPTADRNRIIDSDITVNGTFTATNAGGDAANYLDFDIDGFTITNDGGDAFTIGDHVWIRTSGASNFGTSIGSFASTSLAAESVIRFDGTNQDLPGSGSPATFNGTYGHIHLLGNGDKTALAAMDIEGDIDNMGNTPVFSDAGFSHTIAGDWLLSDFNYTDNMTGTITLDGTNQVVQQSDFFNLAFTNGGTKSIVMDITVGGDFSVATGTAVTGGDEVDLAGNFTVAGTGTYTQTGESFNLIGTGAQIISVSTPTTSYFNNLIVNNSGGTISTTTGFTVGNNFTLTASAGDFDLNGQTVYIANNWDINTGCTLTHGNGTLHFNGAIDQNLYTDAVGVSYYNLIFSGAGEKQLLGNDWDVDGDFTISSATVDQGTRDLTVEGNWINTGGTYQGTARTTLDGINQTVDATDFHDFYAAGTGTKTLQGGIKCTGDFRIENGSTVDAAGFEIQVEEQWYNNLGGTYTHNNGKVTMIGNATQIFSGGTGAGNTFNDLEINLSSSARTLDIETDDLNIDGDFTITLGQVRSEGQSINVEGSFVVTGEMNVNNNASVITFDGSAGTHSFVPGPISIIRNVVIDAAGATYELGGDLTLNTNRDLTINNGTFDLNHNDLQVQGVNADIDINGGTFEIDSASTLIMSDQSVLTNQGGTLRIVGTASSQASISASSGSFTFSQTSGTLHGLYYAISGTSGSGLNISGGTIDAVNNLSNGTFTNGVGTSYMTIASGSYAATATLTGVVFNDNGGLPTNNCTHTAGQQMVFEGSSGTRSGYIYESDDQAVSASLGLIQWTYPSGVFWTGAGDGTSWEDADNWSIPTPPVGTSEAIIDHTNVGAAINIDIDVQDATCSGLTIDAQGGNAITVTLNGKELTVGSDGISIGSSTTLTQTTATDTIFVKGDWANAGTFNEGTSVVVFNDTTGTHTITTAGAADPFNDLVIQASGTANSATYQLGSAVDINDEFSLTGGTFDVVSSSNPVTVGGNWSVTSGTIQPRDGTITFDQGGTATQTISGGTFYNFITSNSTATGTNTKQVLNNLEILNDVTINTNTILDGGSLTLFVKDDWQNNAGAGGFTQTATGTVIFNGTVGTQDVGNGGGITTFNNIYLQGANNKSLSEDMNVTGDMYLLSGIGLVTVASGVQITGVGAGNEFNQTGGNIRIVGADDFPSGFEDVNISGGEVQYRADIDQTIAGVSYYTLRLRSNSGVATTKTADASFTVQSCLDMDDDAVTTLDVNDSTFTLSGTCWRVPTGGPAIDWGTAGGTGTFIQDGAGLTIDADVANFNNIILDGTGTKTQAVDWTIDGDFTIRSGATFNMNTYTSYSTQSDKSMTLSSASILRSSVVSPDTAFPTRFSSYSLDEESITDINGTNAHIYTAAGNIAYGELQLDLSGTATIADGTLDVDGVFDQNSGTIDDNGNDINFGGSVITIRNFTPTVNTTQTFDGGSQTINNDNGGSEALNFYNVVFAGTSTKDVVNDIMDILGNTTINNNVVVEVNESASYGGNFTNNGTYTTTTGTHTFDGTGNQIINPGANHDFNAITFDNGTPNTKTITSNGLDIGNGNFRVEADAIADFGSLTHTIASNSFTINGTWTTTNASLTFDRAGAQNLPGLTAAQDIICATSGTKTLQDDWTLIDDLTIDPTVTLDVNNGNDYTITLTGNWTNNGTFADRNGTVEFESNDNTNKTITTNGSSFYNVTFNQAQTNTRTYSLQDDFNTNEDVTIGSGATLDLNSQTLTLGNNDTGNPASESLIVSVGGTLEVDASAILQLNGNDSGGDPTLDIDGTLRIVGTAGSIATVTREAGGQYIDLNVSGTLEAQYYSIQYLNGDGLNLTAASTLHATNNLSNGAFSNMEENVGATYITLESDVSGLADSIRNITFNFSGTPIIGGDYNITRTRADGGIVNMANTLSGLLTGEDYDNDPNADARITWPVVTITNWTAGAGTTDWFTAGNWDNGVPNDTLDVVISLLGINPIIDGANAKAKSLTLTDGFLRMQNGFDLDIVGDVQIGSTGSGVLAVLNSGCQINIGGGWTIGASGVYSHGNGTLVFDAVSGSNNIQPLLQPFGNITFNGAGNFLINGNMDISGNLIISNGTVTPATNNYNYYIEGDWDGSGGNFLTTTNGTVTLDGAGAQAITGAKFDNLTVSGSGTKTFNGATIINDELIVNSTLVVAAAGSLDMNDNVTINASGSFDDGGETHTFSGGTWTGTGTFAVNTGIIEFDGTSGIQYITASDFNNLSFVGNSRIDLLGNVDVQTNLTVNNSINTFRTGNFTVTNQTGTGTFTLAAGENIYCSGTNSFPDNFSTYAVDRTSNTRFDGTGAQTIRGGAALLYGNIILSSTSTKTLSGDIDIDGYIDINDATLDANNFDIELEGEWINDSFGSFVYGTGELLFNGTVDNPQQIDAGNAANGAKALGNIRIYRLDLGTVEVTDEDLDIDGDFDIQIGDFDQNGHTVYYGADFNIRGNGTFVQSGTSVLDQSSGTSNFRTNNQPLNNVQIVATGGTRWENNTDDIDINGNFSVGAGSIFDVNGFTAVYGNGSNTVTIDGEYILGAGGTMELAPNSQVVVSSTGTFESVGNAANPTSVTIETTGTYNFTIDGTLKAQHYSFDHMGTGGILINATGSIDATDNLSNGTFSNPAAGGTCLRIENTQSFTGGSRIENVSFPNNPGGGASNVTKTTAASGTLEFYGSIGEFSGESLDSDPNNLINWTGPLSVTWNGSISTDWYNPNNWTPSSGPNIIPNSAVDATIPFLVVQPVISSQGAAVGSLTIESGALLEVNTSDNASADLAITSDLSLDGLFRFSGTEDSITIAGNWTRSATGSLDMPSGDISFVSTSGSQFIINGSAATFPNVHINVTGNASLGDNIIIGGDLEINTGTLEVTASNYDVNVKGDFINNSNFDPAQGTVKITGTSGGNIALGTSEFYNVIVSSGAGTYLLTSANTDIDHSLIITNGTLDLNGQTLQVGDDVGNDDVITVNGGTLDVDANASLQLGKNATLSVNSGASFKLVGTDAANEAQLTHINNGFIKIQINSGGTVHARHYNVNYVSTAGFRINTGGIINTTNNFSYGHFLNTPSSGAMLTIENTQELSDGSRIEYVEFEGNGAKNCRKISTTTGNVVFFWAYGSDQGEDYEQDSYDLIQWDANLNWTGAVSTDWHDPDNWDNEIPILVNTIAPTDYTDVILGSGVLANEPLLDGAAGFAEDFDISTDRTLTIASGVAFSVTDSLRVSGGTVTISGASDITVGGSFIQSGGTYTPTTSTLIMTASAADTQQVSMASGNLCGLTINTASAANGLIQTGSALDVDCNFSIQSGTMEVTNPAHTITLAGNWNNDNTSPGEGFIGGTGTVEFNGTGAQTITHDGGHEDFGNVHITNTTAAVQMNDEIDTENLTIDNSAILNANSFDLYIDGNYLNNNAVVNTGLSNNATVIFEGTGLQTITSAAGTTTFNGLQISNTTASVQLANALDLNGRLDIDDNATFNSNSQTINISDTWNNDNTVAGAGHTTGTSTVIFDGTGLQNINHDGNNEAFHHVQISNTSNVIRLNASDIDLSGNLIIDNNATLNGNSRSITIAGNWDNNDASANSGFTFSGTTVTFDGTALQTIDQAGGSSRFNNLVIANTSNSVQLSATVDIRGNLTINDNADFDANNIDFSLDGDWTNNNAAASTGFTPGTAKVTFDGNSTQTITHAGGTESFYDLTINSSAGGTAVSLSDDVLTTNDIELSDGVVTTGANLLINSNTDSSGVIGYSSASFVNGTLRKFITSNTQTYPLPVGIGTAATDYRLAEIINETMLTTSYIDASVGSVTEGGSEIDGNVSISESGVAYDGSTANDAQWEFIPDAQPTGGSTYGVRLYVANITGLVDDQFAPIKRPSASTDYADWGIGAGTTIPADGAAGRTIASGYAQRNGYTSFSFHSIGTAAAPLPIVLLFFNAELIDDEIHLSWTTLSETNNDYFTIERSDDGIHFTEVGLLPGAGTSNTPLEYNYVDDYTSRGTIYYRLSQTDYDGTTEVFEVTTVHSNGHQVISIFPNPATDVITIRSVSDTDDIETVEIYDTKGQLIHTSKLHSMHETISIDHLPSGIYRIIIRNSKWTKSDEITITK